MVKRKTPHKKLTAEQKKRNAENKKFRSTITGVFINSGFHSLPSMRRTMLFAGFPIEFDYLFVYENVLIICEDTIKYNEEKKLADDTGKTFNRNHKLEKKNVIDAISNNTKGFFSELRDTYKECIEFEKYQFNEFEIRYLYFDYKCLSYSDDEKERYKPIIFVPYQSLLYFSSMASCIKKSFRFELFDYLKITKEKIGFARSDNGKRIMTFESPIIHPRTVTGLKNGIRIVSFMMSPGDLIENGFVLRKDSWNDNNDLYQRLLIPKKIQSVRNFILGYKSSFYNNIIVTLPNGVRFYTTDKTPKEIEIDEIVNYRNNVKMQIPGNYNSIAIIDGQHRVYGYYENNIEDEQEIKVSSLRTQLNLLVTGIIYPDEEYWNKSINRRKFEGQLFVSINKNVKSVDSDTLIRVQSIMDATSPEAIARKVIEKLNKEEPFEKLFKVSKLGDGRIATASIIKYVLVSLVAPKVSSTSLFKYWLSKEKHDFDYTIKEEDVESFSSFCKNMIASYFKAVKSRFIQEWRDPNSKILNIVPINAFLIAFRETLEQANGPQSYSFYLDMMKNLEYCFHDTNDSKFKYSSGSRYNAFAREVMIPVFEAYISNYSSDEVDHNR